MEFPIVSSESETRYFYEIEMKALLTPEDHARLSSDLPAKFELIGKDTVHTQKYVPGTEWDSGDVRLRRGNTNLELVVKSGDPTSISRREIVSPIHHPQVFEECKRLLKLSGYKPIRPWTKDKSEYVCTWDGIDYVICLQNIIDFAYILEVEHISEEDEPELHEENLKAIIQDLGCEPIDPKDFKERIAEYIRAKS